MRISESVQPITPEMLLKGYSTNSISIAPSFSIEPPIWVPNNANAIRESYNDLKISREYLRDLYHAEFLQTLIHQAVDKPDRYEPVKHRPLLKGDLVLIREKFQKPLNYPLAIVNKVEYNDIGESVAAYLRKGSTGELTYRHSSSLILLIPNDEEVTSSHELPTENSNNTGQIVANQSNNNSSTIASQRPTRKAAIASRKLLHELIKQNAVQ